MSLRFFYPRAVLLEWLSVRTHVDIRLVSIDVEWISINKRSASKFLLGGFKLSLTSWQYLVSLMAILGVVVGILYGSY